MEDFIFDNLGKIIIVFFVSLVFFIPWAGNAVCEAKTKDMGFDYEWTFLGGCRIEYEEGKWMPLERYRHVDG